MLVYLSGAPHFAGPFAWLREGGAQISSDVSPLGDPYPHITPTRLISAIALLAICSIVGFLQSPMDSLRYRLYFSDPEARLWLVQYHFVVI